jgi:hypothetical protein
VGGEWILWVSGFFWLMAFGLAVSALIDSFRMRTGVSGECSNCKVNERIILKSHSEHWQMHGSDHWVCHECGVHIIKKRKL